MGFQYRQCYKPWHVIPITMLDTMNYYKVLLYMVITGFLFIET